MRLNACCHLKKNILIRTNHKVTSCQKNVFYKVIPCENKNKNKKNKNKNKMMMMMFGDD